MNLIVISYMFPKPDKPYLGVFVKEQLLEINNSIDGTITVISPIAWIPRLPWRTKKNRLLAPAKYSLEGIAVFHPRYLTFPGNVLIFFKFTTMFWSVFNTIKKNQLITNDTVIHAHWMIPDCFIAVILKRLLRTKLVCTAHGDDINSFGTSSVFFKSIIRHIARHADMLIAVSGKLKEKLNEVCPGYAVRVVTNGFNLRLAKSVMDKTKYANDRVNLLFVGNVCFEKGIRELLTSFQRLIEKGANIRLTIIGNLYEKIWLNEFVFAHSLADYVEFVGPVDHCDIFKYYSEADIFVLPSYSEGMPTVMFEAMASRLPIIISRVGGVEEVIIDGVNGLLIEPRSSDDLYWKLSDLINDRNKAEQLAENAFNDAINKYSWQHNAEAMINIYNEILTNKL